MCIRDRSTVVGGSKGYPHFYNSAIHYFERARDGAIEVAVGTGGYSQFTAASGTTYNPANGELVITTSGSHGLSVGDLITVKNIKDTLIYQYGIGNSGFNGEFTITSFPSSLNFEYSTGNSKII